MEDDEKIMIDEEIGRLQEEYETLKENVAEIKISLDVGLVKWNEYDEQFSKCSQWLSEMEPLVQSYAKPQPDLLKKRAKLQEFQVNSNLINFTQQMIILLKLHV